MVRVAVRFGHMIRLLGLALGCVCVCERERERESACVRAGTFLAVVLALELLA